MNMSADKMSWRRALRYGASVLVLTGATMALTPSLALARDDAPNDNTAVDEVVVTGVRASLKTSQQLKRSSDTVVDTITATDIGAFPDKSIAEALQRVPGITVNRLAASDDTSHFSAEPSGVLVRGLSQVRNEFNGRDTFSANSSRGLGWGDVSPELMAGVDTYKNQTAELIEGGIAGTVNLRTRVPFDSSGHLFSVGINGNYGDLSKKFTPEGSMILSDRWETPFGDVGLMGNLAYSEVETQSQGIQYGRMAVLDGLYGPGLKYIPSSVAQRVTTYDRVRNGMAFSAQWQDPSGKLLVTGQYNRSTYENTWKENGVISYPIDMFAKDVRFVYGAGATPQAAPRPALGTPAFTFDQQGNFQTGVMTVVQTDNGWWGASDADSADIALNSSGQSMLHPCYVWQGTCAIDGRGPDVNAVTRYNHNENMTEDGAINLKWNPNDNWKLNADIQKVHSTVENYDIEVGQYSFADLKLDATGDLPRMTLLTPTNINQSPGGLSNPDNYRYNHAMDHRENSEGDEFAIRADAQYLFHSTWMDSLKVGVRYSDRDQTVRYSTFNWANIANDWNLSAHQNVFWNIDKHTANGAFTGYPQGLYDVRSFGGGDFFGGAARDFVFFNMDKLAAHGADALSYANLGVGQDQWHPICTRTGETEGCYLPVEVNHVEEKTKAIYAMLKFGGPEATWGSIRVSGNVGVRYVETKDSSTGSVAYPTPFSPSTLACTPIPTVPPAPAPAIPGTVGCYLSAQDIAFNQGGGASSTVDTTHRNWLPSFNLKLDLNDQWVLRFAASRAMSRPDIGLLKNYINISTSFPGPQDISDPRYIKTGGVVTGVNPTYTADGYNPSLKPTTADQFDISLEYYFSDVGSFSIALFYKKFEDYIQYGFYNRDVTANGVTRSVQVRGPMNGDGASLKGFEVAYQRFFDFLPGAWSGLGVQANFTYVDNTGITNANLKTASGSASGATPQPGTNGTALQVDALEGLSKTSYNLVGMYEKGPWALRLAYNWRSQFLVTAVDCCIYLPMWQKEAGFLDGSIRFRVSDNVELSLQGSNLLNTRTILLQQTTDSNIGGGNLRPGSWFQNDRRIVFGIRMKY
ncbi:MAG: TonB-dependent receptor [Caulobacter sp.]|nr:TonB-dependent receptor [Caulobacter sp.]